MLTLLGVGVPSVRAATILDVGEAVAPKGATVVVDMVLTSDQNVAALQFDLLYDNRRLTTESTRLSQAQTRHTVDSRDVAPGRLRVAVYPSANAVLADGPLVSLPFVIAPNVGSGELPLTLDVAQVVFSTVAGQSISADELLNGAITVDETVGVFRIAGRVHYFGGGNEPLPEIRLRLLGADTIGTDTDAEGRFELLANGGNDYRLEAVAPGIRLAPESGVDVGDLVALRKHLLGFGDIDSPFGALAGDVDGDRALTELDVERVRGMLLGEATTLQGSVGVAGESLFFLPSDLSFVDRRDPWGALGAANANAVRRISGLGNARFGEDFAGIKLGDVNGDWRSVGTELPLETPSSGFGSVELRLRSGYGVPGGEIRLPLFAESSDPLLGLQFDLGWDPSVLQFDRFENVRLPGFDPAIHTAEGAERDQVRVVWADPIALGLQIGSAEPVLELVFQAVADAELGAASRVDFLGGSTQVLGYGFDGRQDMQAQDAIVVLAAAPDFDNIVSVGDAVLTRFVPGETLELWAFAEDGRTYILETTLSFSDPNWEEIAQAVAADGLVEFSVAADAAFQRYFRLLELAAENNP